MAIKFGQGMNWEGLKVQNPEEADDKYANLSEDDDIFLKELSSFGQGEE